ncbi:MAG: PEP-CTERM sorting domain-containing protein, partial [Chthoniobacterales bacterium]
LWVYQIGTGLLTGDGVIPLTEQSWFEGSPGDGIPSDPYGHIHGRAFGVDIAGSFTATWVLHDTQTGATGLLDSTSFTSSFTAAAVPEPASLLLLAMAAGGMLAREKYRRLRRICRD